jgi:hypothetical protein
MASNVFSTTLSTNARLRGRYTIMRLVGGGGMGSVYEALDAHLHGRRVAVKELNSALLTNPQEAHSAIAMFQQEAQLLAMLQHPNLPRVSDFFSEGNKQYLVMDFVDGRTLEKVLEENRGPLNEMQAAALGAQLCSVLAYLHACQPPIIFRDLKPANIMLDHTNQIKLIDFGIARLYKPGHRSDTHQFGSPGYAPPEQYGQNQTDARSDVYSLAVTLYYLLTRHDPALTPFNQPGLRTLNPSVAPQLEQIITRGMAHDPNQRWQSAQQFGAALSNFRPATGGAGQTSRPTTRLILKAAELPAWQLALAIVVITIGALVAAYLFTPLVARIPLIWDNLDVIALIAPLAYAATHQRFVAGIAHATIATLGGIAVWSSLGIAPAVPLILAIALAVGAFAEVWLAFLPRVRGKGTDPWQREVAWLAGLAVIVTAATRILLVSFGFGANPVLWFVSALIGGVGWFIGDLIQQYLFLRQRGFKRVGYF